MGEKAKKKYTEKAKRSSEEYEDKKMKLDHPEASKVLIFGYLVFVYMHISVLKTACDIIRILIVNLLHIV